MPVVIILDGDVTWLNESAEDLVHSARNMGLTARIFTERPQATPDQEYLDLDIEELDFSRRIFFRLKRGGINTVADLLARCPDDLLDIPQFGAKSLAAVKRRLATDGLHLQPNYDERPAPPHIANQPIENLNLSKRAYNCLTLAGLHHIGDVAALCRHDLLRLERMNEESADEIIGKLLDIGVSLRTHP